MYSFIQELMSFGYIKMPSVLITQDTWHFLFEISFHLQSCWPKIGDILCMPLKHTLHKLNSRRLSC